MQRKHAKNIQSKDFSQTKYTPRTRPAHESAHDGQLVNPNPNLKYCLVPMDKNHPLNYMYYKSMGYEFVNKEKDGVSIRMGTDVKDGCPLEWRGMVLMACTAERAEEIFQNGPSGNTGQKYFDNLMSRIRRNPTEKREVIPGLTEKYDINDPDEDLANNTFR